LLLNYKFEKNIDANSDYFVNRSLIAARVYILGGRPALGMAVYPFLLEKKTILYIIRELFARYREKIPDSTWESFLKQETPLLLFWFKMTALMNQENDDDDEEEDDENYEEEYEDTSMSDILICNALFVVHDYRAAKKKLESSPYFSEYDRDIYEWYDEPGYNGEADLLGILTISSKKMALVTSSPELRERGKFLLLSVCRDIVSHDRDFEGLQDLENL
jgi:hypothetical protein